MSTPGGSSQNPRGTTALWAGVVTLALVLATAVGLIFAGLDVERIIYLMVALGGVGGVGVATIGKVTSVSEKTDEQSQVLRKLEFQTNGSLDARIYDRAAAAVRDELRAAGIGNTDDDSGPIVADTSGD